LSGSSIRFGGRQSKCCQGKSVIVIEVHRDLRFFTQSSTGIINEFAVESAGSGGRDWKRISALKLTATTQSSATPAAISSEIARRRTFAIISHPDAGKTTLTEKLLLYGGAIHLAGSVTARKTQQSTTSDWMELEKQRGISVSSTVLQFEYDGYCVNLLDTPGHKDFSEDTYRVLAAVDAAVMVVDAGKGIESQTLKLFEVCRRRGVPIFVFINKLDRPSRAPLDLIDELERVLGLPPVPLTWPLGDGPRFRGVFDREKGQVHLFERTPHGAYRAPIEVKDVTDVAVREALDAELFETVTEEIEMLEGLTETLDMDAVLAGKQMPVFFGSAMNNFGVQHMLERFLELAPAPTPRMSGDQIVDPAGEEFSGFVFKIQANMNPKHRDRATFIRIVSGVFERDMMVTHTRTGKRIRLSNSQRLFGQDRETLDLACAGDILALVGNYDFLIGDTITINPKIEFKEMPRFKPECFAYVVNSDTANNKRFRAGLDQLLKEGVAQSYEVHGNLQRVPLLGAVGPLQFEVFKYRLETEYKAECRIDPAPWDTIVWLRPKPGEDGSIRTISGAPEIAVPTGGVLAEDLEGQWLVLLPSEWLLNLLKDRNPDFDFQANPFERTSNTR
jgi:peptide chain release factor 3